MRVDWEAVGIVWIPLVGFVVVSAAAVAYLAIIAWAVVS